MGDALRVLIVEDSEDDARLLVRFLTKQGFEVTARRVDTAEGMQAALDEEAWDVILSDHTMPRFNALAALDTLQHSGRDLPFIIVSGVMGEDMAVEAMRSGAHDYIVKGNLARLAPAIRRELRDATVRRERRLADEALRAAHAELEVRVKERTAELEATLASIPDGLVLYSLSGEIVRMNPTAERILGIPESARHVSMAERLRSQVIETPDGRPFPLEELPATRALSGETVQGVVLVYRREPNPACWLSNSAAPIFAPDGTRLGAVSTFTDITALHEVQAQLQESRGRMEETLHLIAHDVRQPLTGANGMAQLLYRALQQKGMDSEARNAEAILTSVRRMNAMIQDLVESARLELGQLDLHKEQTDLYGLILDVVGRLGTTGENARIRVESVEPLPPLSLDPNRIERVIVNLVTNALKYSPPKSPVVVRVGQRADEAIVTVTDRGIGIPREEVPHVLERGFRAREARRTRGGLGLGLYIARLIVEDHGGRIWVESQVGQGSTFGLSLPLA